MPRNAREYQDYLKRITKEANKQSQSKSKSKHRNKKGLASTDSRSSSGNNIIFYLIVLILCVQLVNWFISYRLSLKQEEDGHNKIDHVVLNRDGSIIESYGAQRSDHFNDVHDVIPRFNSNPNGQKEDPSLYFPYQESKDKFIPYEDRNPYDVGSSQISNKWFVWGDDKQGVKTQHNTSISDLYKYPLNEERLVCERPVYDMTMNTYNKSLWNMHLKTMGQHSDVFNDPSESENKFISDVSMSGEGGDDDEQDTYPSGSDVVEINKEYQRIENAKMYISMRLNGLPLSGLYSSEFIVSELFSSFCNAGHGNKKCEHRGRTRYSKGTREEAVEGLTVRLIRNVTRRSCVSRAWHFSVYGKHSIAAGVGPLLTPRLKERMKVGGNTRYPVKITNTYHTSGCLHLRDRINSVRNVSDRMERRKILNAYDEQVYKKDNVIDKTNGVGGLDRVGVVEDDDDGEEFMNSLKNEEEVRNIQYALQYESKLEESAFSHKGRMKLGSTMVASLGPRASKVLKRVCLPKDWRTPPRLVEYNNRRFIQKKEVRSEFDMEESEKEKSIEEGYYVGKWRFKYLVVLRNPARVTLSKLGEGGIRSWDSAFLYDIVSVGVATAKWTAARYLWHLTVLPSDSLVWYYEDLESSPVECMRALCAFLGFDDMLSDRRLKKAYKKAVESYPLKFTQEGAYDWPALPAHDSEEAMEGAFDLRHDTQEGSLWYEWVLRPPPLVKFEDIEEGSKSEEKGSKSELKKGNKKMKESIFKRYTQPQHGRQVTYGKHLLSIEEEEKELEETSVIGLKVEKEMQDMLNRIKSKEERNHKITDVEPNVIKEDVKEIKTYRKDMKDVNNILSLLEAVQGSLWGCDEEESQEEEEDNSFNMKGVIRENLEQLPAVMNAKKLLFSKWNHSNTFSNNTSSTVVLNELCCRYYTRPFIGQKQFGDIIETDDVTFIKENKMKEKKIRKPSPDLKCAAYQTSSSSSSEHVTSSMLTTNELSTLWLKFIEENQVNIKSESVYQQVERSKERRKRKFAEESERMLLQYFNTTNTSTIKKVNKEFKLQHEKEQEKELSALDIATIQQKPFYLRARQQSENSKRNKEKQMVDKDGEHHHQYDFLHTLDKHGTDSRPVETSGIIVVDKFDVVGKGSWEKALDPTSKQFYYFNRATGVSQWEPP